LLASVTCGHSADRLVRRIATIVFPSWENRFDLRDA
jgi:hypothetical protein